MARRPGGVVSLVQSCLQAALAVVVQSVPAFAAPGTAGVVVVVNQSSSVSMAIGDYYCRERGLDRDQVCRLPIGTPTDREISRSIYESEIREPIARQLRQLTFGGAKIDTLILTQDVPVVIRNSYGVGRFRSQASVDSELTQLFTSKVGAEGQSGFVYNPLFGTYGLDLAAQKSSISLLVFRLMGGGPLDPQSGIPVDLRSMIDAAVRGSSGHDVILRPTQDHPRSRELTEDLEQLLDGSDVALTHSARKHESVLLDISWDTNIAGTEWVASATSEMLQLVSTTLPPEPPSVPCAAPWSRDLVVFPVQSDQVVRPAMLIDRYLRGIPLGLAYYQSLPCLSWAHVIVCDPLQVSSITLSRQPRLHTTDPDRVRHGLDLLGFRLYGSHFTHSNDMEVLVDGQIRCRNLHVTGSESLTCELPALLPGIHTITLRNFEGASEEQLELVAYPAIALDGMLVPDEEATLVIHGRKGERYQLLLGVAEFADGPSRGRLSIDPSRGFYILRSGVLTEDTIELHGKVRHDPNLEGKHFFLQASIGQELAQQGEFTNLLEIVHP